MTRPRRGLTPFQAFAIALVVSGLVWAAVVVLTVNLFT